MPALRITGTNLSLTSRLGAAQRAGDHAALAVEVLGARMDDEVGAELDRLLQRRRAEAVVDRQQRAAGVRDLGQRARCRRPRSAGCSASRRTAACVFGRIAARHARRRSARRRWSRRRTCANSPASSLIVEPNTLLRADHVVAGLQQAHARAAGSPPCRWRWRCRPRCPPAPPGGAPSSSPSGWRSGCRRRPLPRWRSAPPRWPRRGARSCW